MTRGQADILLIKIGKINVIVMLLPIIVAIWQRKYLNKPLRIFLFYCITTFCINFLEQLIIWLAMNHPKIIMPYLQYWGIGNTNFLLILYHLKDFIFLGWFYGILLATKYGVWVKRIAGLLSVMALMNYLFIEGFRGFGIVNPAADAIFSFSLPAFYLWYLFKYMLHFPVHKNPYFWISFGLVITNLIGLFLYLAGDTMHETDYILFAKVSIARNIFDMVAQVIFAIGFWHAPYAKYIALPEKGDTQPTSK